MKNYLYTALAAGALASAALGLAGTANAAPAGPSSVDATIRLSSNRVHILYGRVAWGPRSREPKV